MNPAVAPSILVGFWSLKSWDQLFPDGTKRPYTDQAVNGFLHYAPDGLMSVSIFLRDEPKLLTAYGGSYEYLNDEVIHYPTLAQSPSGLEKKRRFVSVTATTLTLTTAWIDAPSGSYKYSLGWTKSA